MIEFTRKALEVAYDGKIVSCYKDYLETPDGTSVVYDLIRHKSGGGAGILLVDDKEYTYLVRLYRNSIDAVSIEIPAGGYSTKDETGEICAVREAEEETGFFPKKIYHVANVVSSIGTFDEKTDVFIGTNLVSGTCDWDPEEYIELMHVSIEDAMKMVYDGTIVDSKTVLALFAYQEYKRNGIISS